MFRLQKLYITFSRHTLLSRYISCISNIRYQKYNGRDESMSFQKEAINTKKYEASVKNILPFTSYKFDFSLSNSYLLMRIQSCSSSVELLNFSYLLLQCKRLHPSFYVSIFGKLGVLLYYRELRQFIPWLNSSAKFEFVGIRQLYMNNELHYLPPNTCSKEFTGLVQGLSKVLDKIKLNDQARIYCRLFSLGLPITSPVLNKILDNLQNLDKPLDVRGLAALCEVISLFPQQNILAQQIVIPRLRVLQDVIKIDTFLLMEHLKLLYLWNKYFDEYDVIVYEKYLYSVLEYVTDSSNHIMITPYQIQLTCKLLKQIFLNSNSAVHQLLVKQHKFSEVVEKFMKLLPSFVSQINHRGQFVEIGGLFMALGTATTYTGKLFLKLFHMDIVTDVHARSRNMLYKQVPTLNIADLACYMFILPLAITIGTRKRMESLLEKHLQDADLFTMKSILTIYQLNKDIKIPPHIWDILKNNLLRDFTGTGDHDSLHLGLYNVSLLRDLTIKQEYLADFITLLLKVVDGGYGCITKTFVEASANLLPLFKEAIPDYMFTRIKEIILRGDMTHLRVLLNGLFSMELDISPILTSQFVTILNSLEELVDKEKDNLDLLCCVLEEILMNHKDYNTEVTSLIEKLTLYIKELKLDRNAYFSLLSAITSSKLYIEELLDILLEYYFHNLATENLPSSYQHLYRFVACLKSCSFIPRQSDLNTLHDFAQNIFDRYFDTVRPVVNVSTLSLLCHLDIFLDKYLGQVFTVQFLQDLNNTAAFQESSIVTFNLMRINRFIVLECPHLNKPWVIEEKRQIKKIKKIPQGFTFPSDDVDSVGDVITDVLGGEEYYGFNVITPYLYQIQFEIVLDSQNSPILYSEVRDTKENPELQRLAVVMLGMTSYVNSISDKCTEILIFPVRTMIRHLEILNYKVITIPYYEWNSPELTREEEKRRYMRNKLFS